MAEALALSLTLRLSFFPGRFMQRLQTAEVKRDGGGGGVEGWLRPREGWWAKFCLKEWSDRILVLVKAAYEKSVATIYYALSGAKRRKRKRLTFYSPLSRSHSGAKAIYLTNLLSRAGS
jgi:hypothetical protein